MILTTGIGNGLGRLCHETLGGKGLRRENASSLLQALKPSETRIIVHCAFNTGPAPSSNRLAAYLDDTLLLTRKLTRVPHRKFIFVSSVDVYPHDGVPHDENEELSLEGGQSFYGLAKLMSEAIVRVACPNYLILRPTSLLGYSKKSSSLIRILEEPAPQLSLSADSVLNCVQRADVCKFIQNAIDSDLQGTYNIASSQNITLANAARRFGRGGAPHYGDFRYDVGLIDQRRATILLPVFNRSSEETLAHYSRKRP